MSRWNPNGPIPNGDHVTRRTDEDAALNAVAFERTMDGAGAPRDLAPRRDRACRANHDVHIALCRRAAT